MQVKILVCLSIILVCFGKWAVANEGISIRSVHSAQTGDVSIVVDLPPGTKAKPSQFRLIEDNKITASARSILPFSDSDWKLAIVFCIDKSGSINDKQLETTKNALKSLLRKPLFKKQDRLALVSFENEPRVIQWFTQPKEIYKRISELQNMKGQHTVLYDTLFDSLGHVNSDSINSFSPVLKRILVISDGENYGGSRQNTTEVREKAIETGVAIDAVLLNPKKKNADTMQILANDTGGTFINTNSDGIEAALNEIFNEILSAYVVYFERYIDTTSPKTVRVGVQFQNANQKLITNSVQAGISQSAVDIPELPPPDETPEVTVVTPPTPEPIVEPAVNWFLWFLVFILFAVLLAYVIWRSRQKAPAKPGVSEPKVGIDKKISTPVQPSPPSYETKTRKTVVGQRRKTLVGSSSFPIARTGSPIAILICLSGPLEGQQFSIEQESFRIGANPENDLCLTQDEYVSGDHAYLRYENGNLTLVDMGSSNGTFVNDAPVTDTGINMTPGEQIRIGTSVFEIAPPAD
ncbi:MAG: VWA domain-containing protein [Desulfobulbaceae bacterium]|nr:VWA domain-containing protein [Desulfobulbaceae bacterium]